MEVGELLIALIVVVTLGCTWWSFRRQKLMSEFLRARRSALRSGRELVDTQPASSVLEWDGFSIASTLFLDGTVLVSCTRQPMRPISRGRLGHDGSLVLLIGDDEKGIRAFHLIEDWRAAGTTLQLRPTTLARAIELYDGRHNALRAQLLAT